MGVAARRLGMPVGIDDGLNLATDRAQHILRVGCVTAVDQQRSGIARHRDDVVPRPGDESQLVGELHGRKARLPERRARGTDHGTCREAL